MLTHVLVRTLISSKSIVSFIQTPSQLSHFSAKLFSCQHVKAMTTSSTKSIVAVAQMTSTADKDENLATTRRLIGEASHLGAKVVFLPEACDYMAESQVQSLGLAENLDGPLIKCYSELAVEHNIWISIGGFHNKGNLVDKMYNTHLVIDSQGKISGSYNKTHLFDVEIPEKKIKLKESDYIEKGSEVAPLVDSPVGKIGLGICYDMRFPEFSLSLARMGADIITYPSAFTVATGLAHWQSLLRARAIETQCYVIAAAQTGFHNSKRSSYGHAMVIDPWGAIIAQCREGTGLALAQIDLEYLNKVRREMPVFAHRRQDVYRLPTPPCQSLMPPNEEETFPFGSVTIQGWAVFYRTRHSVAFVNRKCVVPGHVLVMPIKSFKRLPDMDVDGLADLFLAAQQVQRGMERIHGVSSSTVVVQDGPDAGQTIEKVHVHILPRRHQDYVNNDNIYDDLKRHDKGPNVVWRENDDMKQEADQLRQFFYSTHI